MKNVVLSVVAFLFERPEEIVVTELRGAKTVVFEVRCPENTAGRIIGKGGRTANGIRTMLNALAGRDNRRAVLEIVG